MNPLIWIDFEGVLIGQTAEALRFQGPSVAGAMVPTWIPRSCLGRILFTTYEWRKANTSNKVQLTGRGVCAMEIDINFAKKVGLA